MTPIQQIFLGMGAVPKKTYIDDIFSTYLWTGTGSAITINNGIDLSGEGGMVWEKQRDGTSDHNIVDTVRGASAGRLRANGSNAEGGTNYIASFNSTGFVTGTDSDVTGSGETFASFTFRRASGFFDCVKWQGNGTAGRQISHSLNCVPGMIIVKSRSTNNWYVYHRGTHDTSPEDYVLMLDGTDARIDAALFNDTLPTSTHFTLNGGDQVNGSGTDYVAYVFAGGEDQTTATSRSVDYDGTDDYLSIPDHADYELGSGDFTLECWVKTSVTSTDYRTVFGKWQGSGQFSYMIRSSNNDPANGWVFFYSTTGSAGGHTIVESGVNIHDGQWHHLAVTRTGGKVRLFTDGNLSKEENITATIYNSTAPVVIASDQGDQWFTGKISNVRIVNGTAVYTSAFRPPTEPLTNVTNTKLLCCNNSSVTGSTVCTGTITAGSSPTASTDSPFDDPAGFVFGDSEEGIVKCGSYVGNGSSDGTQVNLGWEPSFLLIKRASGGTGDWRMFDNMRGLSGNGVTDSFLEANTTDTEVSNLNCVDISSTGFELKSSDTNWNNTNDTYIYLAIRRSDGYVGKPAEAGADVFSMDTGVGSGEPAFDSTHVVDMAFTRQPASTHNWLLTNRLTGINYLTMNLTNAESDVADYKFDHMSGWAKDHASSYQSWMWKRHAGFDVVTYAGVASTYSASGVGSISVPHSLNAVPEMIWVKNRTYEDANGWAVYHKGLNGGTNPEQYRIRLQGTNAEDDNVGAWQDTAPTSTHFTLGTDRMVNQSPNSYLAMLFASVDGISKCGYFDGSDSEQTITTGFQPRLLILKATGPTNEYWYIFDTTRGWSSGNDATMWLNTTNAQWSSSNYGEPTSTGFTLPGNHAGTNDAGKKYIYYAHA